MTDHPEDHGPDGAPEQGAPSGDGLTAPDDTSGIDNLLEEGGPLEPADVEEVEGSRTDEAAQSMPPTPSVEDELAAAKVALAERTEDLQRKQAELVNYRARVERDRLLTQENAKFQVLSPIVEVLDTIDRAREHGELEEGLRTVAEQLERTVAGLGLTKFGQPGDAFDPNRHEALSHIGTDPEVTVTTCKVIAKAGYAIGERVVRAAQVLVVDPDG